MGDYLEEKISFDNGKGDKIVGVLSSVDDKSRPLIISCHGLSSTKDSKTAIAFQDRLNKNNISTFRFDFFAHGESEGKFEDLTISEAVNNVLKAIALFKDKGYTKIGLIGSSFGGIASIMAASQSRDLFVLALKCPVSNYYEKRLNELGEDGLKQWKEHGYQEYLSGDGRTLRLSYEFLEDSKKNNGYKAAKHIKIPAIIVHGDKDYVVPIEQSKKTAIAMDYCILEEVSGAGHRFKEPEEFNQMIDLITNFIIEHSK